MVEFPIDPLWRVVALLPHVAPVLRHAGWFGFFLILAPVIGPRGYGLFVLALSGIAVIEALLAETASYVLGNLAAPEERHWSTALVTLMVVGIAVSLGLYAAAGAIGAMVDEGSSAIFSARWRRCPCSARWPWSLVAQVIVQRLVQCTALWGIPGERIGIAWSRPHFDRPPLKWSTLSYGFCS